MGVGSNVGVSVEVAVPVSCELGEGSLWDVESGRLYWVDIVGKRVFSFEPSSGDVRSHAVPEDVGTVVLTRGGELLLGLRSGIAWLDPESSALHWVARPEPDKPGNRLNDGKCDPEGRLWVGSMVEDGQRGNGALFCLDVDLQVTPKFGGVNCSNGLVWSRDANTFFYIDTPTQEIHAFDFERASGALSRRRVVASFPRELGGPDGMTIDSEDRLWVALWGGSKVVRIDPTTGERGFELDIPAEHVTSCAFGGPELDELYVTTARIGLDAAALARQPLAGSLFRARVPFRGVPAMRFERRFR